MPRWKAVRPDAAWDVTCEAASAAYRREVGVEVGSKGDEAEVVQIIMID